MNVAVLLKGGYVRKRLKKARRSFTVQDILAVGSACVDDSAGEKLFRLYYYDCDPYVGKQPHPVTGETQHWREQTTVQEDLSRQETVAYRRGRLAFRGWKLTPPAFREFRDGKRGTGTLQAGDVQPEFQQKGVDVKIGLDIAWLSSKRVVEKLVLVSADNDFIPAMKFARREGIGVQIATIDQQPQPAFREHADWARVIETGKLFATP
jgi:uncharacterized LabA/DUF88 family protein